MIEKHTRYIDLKVDWSFKRIFGTEANRDLLIALLNEIFKGRKTIIDLTYNKNEHQGENSEQAKAIFDVLCTGDNGEKFIIEVQNSIATNFKKRAIYYTSKLVSEQALKGETGSWQYNITEVYFVAILEKESEISTNKTRYFHDIVLSYRGSEEIFHDGLGYIFIDLVNFVKSEEDCKNDLDEWFYWIKHLPEVDELPNHLKGTVFEKLFKESEYNNLNPEDKTMYDQNLKIKWDNAAAEAYAIQKGEEKGEARGIEIGIQKEKEAAQKRSILVVKNLKKRGMSNAEINEVTGLSIEEIETL